MSFPHLQQQQSDLSQAAQMQKMNQMQHLQQMNSGYSPQITQRGLNPNAMMGQAQPQLQPPQPLIHTQPQPQLQHPSLPPLTAVKEVWAENVHQELAMIRELITHFNYVSVSTEFPGILARPVGVFSSTADYHYQTLRANSDLLSLIQIGISLSDAKGKKPDNIYSTWQFNFKFDLNTKMISDEAYESLMKTGIDFHKLGMYGIDQFEFAELLTSSGLVLLPNVHWSSFHAGYDFGFLISLLTNNLMPSKEEEFLHKISLYFPHLYDLKILSKHASNNKDGNMKQTLEGLADELGVTHGAGANYVSTAGQAQLTTMCLAELMGRVPELEKFAGEIHGLKNGYPLNSMVDQ